MNSRRSSKSPEILVQNKIEGYLLVNKVRVRIAFSKEKHDPNAFYSRKWINFPQLVREKLLSKMRDADTDTYLHMFLERNSKEENSITINELYKIYKPAVRRLIKYLLENHLSQIKELYISDRSYGADVSVFQFVEGEIYNYPFDNKSIKVNKFRKYDILTYFVDNSNDSKMKFHVTVGISSLDTWAIEPKYFVFLEKECENIMDKQLQVVKDNGTIERISIREILNKVKISINSLKYIILNNVLRRKIQDKISKSKEYKKRVFYKSYLNYIKEFIDAYLKNNNIDDIVRFPNSNLLTVQKKEEVDDDKVYFFDIIFHKHNYMSFANNKVAPNAYIGMRDYGPYEIPQLAGETQLLFIYPDRESANTLYRYFKRGLKHFPGLETYVGIACVPHKRSFKYESLDDLFNKAQKMLPDYSNSREIPDTLVVCIIPFRKSTANDNEKRVYYRLKELLLKKNLPSQFIFRDNIFKNNFPYHLPNIASAMLAKIGGIPWKLKSDEESKLVIGINLSSSQSVSEQVLGVTVFFDNTGKFLKLKSYRKTKVEDVIRAILQDLRQREDSLNMNFKPVIHLYKPPKKKEVIEIEDTIKDLYETERAIFVEINDSRSTIDMCFDTITNPDIYMPVSGTFVNIYPKKRAYLLFNNLRYRVDTTLRGIREELPIKLRLYPSQDISHNEIIKIIAQIYEFSRINWRGMKQKALPVTMEYSKLLADFVLNFGNREIPDTYVANRTPWFL